MALPNTLPTPSLLQKYLWITEPVGFMESAAQKYPDIFTAKIIGFGETAVFVNHPQGIQEILTNDRKKFAALGKENRIIRPLVGDYSVIMLEGDRHRQRRQLLMPPFHGERLLTYGQLIRNLAEKVFSQLPKNQPFLARTAMQEIALQVILEAVFGLYESERHQQIKRQIVSMMNLFSSPFTSSFLFFPSLQQDLGAWNPWGKFIQARKQADELLYAEIAERRQQPHANGTDILSLLISARDEQGQPMTDEELRDELITLLFAGHETTASSMAWALYWLHKKPEVLEKLRQEIDSLGDTPDPVSISRLPYLTDVCNETLRLYPVAMLTFPRVVQEPIEILGYSLDPGTVLMGCIYLVHHREELYPQSYEFQPERFLNRQFSPYEFLPFGGGVRRCIGDALAPFEMKLVLATILSRYQLALTSNQPEKPQRRGVTLTPSRGVEMVVRGKRTRQESPMSLATT